MSLAGLALADRPTFFDQLLPRLIELRGRMGQPHWIIIDEAHHLMPTAWTPSADRMPLQLHNLVMITVHPQSVSRDMLAEVDLVLALGDSPDKTIEEFCSAASLAVPSMAETKLDSGDALAYWVNGKRPPFRLTPVRPRQEQQRHRRKYAEGRLPPDRSFVFRGPANALNLRAYNLITFLELAAGVNDETWLHHLKLGEYSNWFRTEIKDEELAREAELAESKFDGKADQSRDAIRKAIEARYTLPTEPTSGSS
jgi:hypothetical protein